MKHDPIVKEIHAVREELLASCGNNFEKLVDDLIEKQKENIHYDLQGRQLAHPLRRPE